MQPVVSTTVRYIKLGPGGAWVDWALERNELHFGYKTIAHDTCVARDWATVERALLSEGRTPAKAKDALREIREFYSSD